MKRVLKTLLLSAALLSSAAFGVAAAAPANEQFFPVLGQVLYNRGMLNAMLTNAAAQKYAAEKHIQPRDCGAEG